MRIGLEFEPSQAARGGLSFPVAYIVLMAPDAPDDTEAVRVSQACVSVSELEAAVRSLHRQLEGALAQGRARFAST